MQRRYKRNLRRTLALATDEDKRIGCEWYETANFQCKVLSDRYSLPLSSVCGIVAALSPGRDWNLNLRDANDFIRAFVKGARGRELPPVGSYGSRNIAKAEVIAGGRDALEVLGGRKV